MTNLLDAMIGQCKLVLQKNQLKVISTAIENEFHICGPFLHNYCSSNPRLCFEENKENSYLKDNYLATCVVFFNSAS